MDSGLIWVAVCGLALVCAGTFLVVAFLVVRTTGGRLWDAFSGIGGVVSALDTGEGAEADGVTRTTARRERRSSGDFRDRIQSLDFDSAVARQAENPSPPTSPVQPTGYAFSEPETGLTNTQPNSPPFRRRRRERDEDEIFGGFLDEDGDGTIDF